MDEKSCLALAHVKLIPNLRDNEDPICNNIRRRRAKKYKKKPKLVKYKTKIKIKYHKSSRRKKAGSQFSSKKCVCEGYKIVGDISLNESKLDENRDMLIIIPEGEDGLPHKFYEKKKKMTKQGKRRKKKLKLKNAKRKEKNKMEKKQDDDLMTEKKEERLDDQKIYVETGDNYFYLPTDKYKERFEADNKKTKGNESDSDEKTSSDEEETKINLKSKLEQKLSDLFNNIINLKSFCDDKRIPPSFRKIEKHINKLPVPVCKIKKPEGVDINYNLNKDYMDAKGNKNAILPKKFDKNNFQMTNFENNKVPKAYLVDLDNNFNNIFKEINKNLKIKKYDSEMDYYYFGITIDSYTYARSKHLSNGYKPIVVQGTDSAPKENFDYQDFSKNRLLSIATIFYAVVLTLNVPMENWDPNLIDKIIEKGMEIQSESYKQEFIITNGINIVHDIPGTSISIRLTPIIEGFIDGSPTLMQTLCHSVMDSSLLLFIHRNTYLYIVCVKGMDFYIFDPNGRQKETLRDFWSGKASLIRVDGISSVIYLILFRSNITQQDFSYPYKFFRISIGENKENLVSIDNLNENGDDMTEEIQNEDDRKEKRRQQLLKNSIKRNKKKIGMGDDAMVSEGANTLTMAGCTEINKTVAMAAKEENEDEINANKEDSKESEDEAKNKKSKMEQNKNDDKSAIASLFAIIYRNIEKPVNWKPDSINEIIKASNKYYEEFLKQNNIKTLYLDDLPNTINAFRNKYFVKTQTFFDVCFLPKDGTDYSYNVFRKSLLKFLHINKVGILEIDGKSIAIWYSNNSYFIFYPFASTIQLPPPNNSSYVTGASINLFDTFETFFKFIQEKANILKTVGNFFLHAVQVKLISQNIADTFDENIIQENKLSKVEQIRNRELALAKALELEEKANNDMFQTYFQEMTENNNLDEPYLIRKSHNKSNDSEAYALRQTIDYFNGEALELEEQANNDMIQTYLQEMTEHNNLDEPYLIRKSHNKSNDSEAYALRQTIDHFNGEALKHKEQVKNEMNQKSVREMIENNNLDEQYLIRKSRNKSNDGEAYYRSRSTIKSKPFVVKDDDNKLSFDKQQSQNLSEYRIKKIVSLQYADGQHEKRLSKQVIKSSGIEPKYEIPAAKIEKLNQENIKNKRTKTLRKEEVEQTDDEQFKRLNEQAAVEQLVTLTTSISTDTNLRTTSKLQFKRLSEKIDARVLDTVEEKIELAIHIPLHLSYGTNLEKEDKKKAKCKLQIPFNQKYILMRNSDRTSLNNCPKKPPRNLEASSIMGFEICEIYNECYGKSPPKRISNKKKCDMDENNRYRGGCDSEIINIKDNIFNQSLETKKILPLSKNISMRMKSLNKSKNVKQQHVEQKLKSVYKTKIPSYDRTVAKSVSQTNKIVSNTTINTIPKTFTINKISADTSNTKIQSIFNKQQSIKPDDQTKEVGKQTVKVFVNEESKTLSEETNKNFDIQKVANDACEQVTRGEEYLKTAAEREKLNEQQINNLVKEQIKILCELTIKKFSNEQTKISSIHEVEKRTDEHFKRLNDNIFKGPSRKNKTKFFHNFLNRISKEGVPKSKERNKIFREMSTKNNNNVRLSKKSHHILHVKDKKEINNQLSKRILSVLLIRKHSNLQAIFKQWINQVLLLNRSKTLTSKLEDSSRKNFENCKINKECYNNKSQGTSNKKKISSDENRRLRGGCDHNNANTGDIFEGIIYNNLKEFQQQKKFEPFYKIKIPGYEYDKLGFSNNVSENKKIVLSILDFIIDNTIVNTPTISNSKFKTKKSFKTIPKQSNSQYWNNYQNFNLSKTHTNMSIASSCKSNSSHFIELSKSGIGFNKFKELSYGTSILLGTKLLHSNESINSNNYDDNAINKPLINLSKSILTALMSIILNEKFLINMWNSQILDYIKDKGEKLEKQFANTIDIFQSFIYNKIPKIRMGSKYYSTNIFQVCNGNLLEIDSFILKLKKSLKYYKKILLILKKFNCSIFECNESYDHPNNNNDYIDQSNSIDNDKCYYMFIAQKTKMINLNLITNGYIALFKFKNIQILCNQLKFYHDQYSMNEKNKRFLIFGFDIKISNVNDKLEDKNKDQNVCSRRIPTKYEAVKHLDKQIENSSNNFEFKTNKEFDSRNITVLYSQNQYLQYKSSNSDIDNDRSFILIKNKNEIKKNSSFKIRNKIRYRSGGNINSKKNEKRSLKENKQTFEFEDQSIKSKQKKGKRRTTKDRNTENEVVKNTEVNETTNINSKKNEKESLKENKQTFEFEEQSIKSKKKKGKRRKTKDRNTENEVVKNIKVNETTLLQSYNDAFQIDKNILPEGDEDLFGQDMLYNEPVQQQRGVSKMNIKSKTDLPYEQTSRKSGISKINDNKNKPEISTNIKKSFSSLDRKNSELFDQLLETNDTSFKILHGGIGIITGDTNFHLCDANNPNKIILTLNGLMASFISIILATKFNLEKWNSIIIDYALKKGVDLQKKYITNSNIISLFLYNSIPQFNIGNTDYETECIKICHESTKFLKTKLELLTQIYENFLLLVPSFNCSIFKRNNIYYLYIPYPSDKFGFTAKVGSAVLLRFKDLSLLVNRIRDYRYKFKTDTKEKFILFVFEFFTIKNKKQEKDQIFEDFINVKTCGVDENDDIFRNRSYTLVNYIEEENQPDMGYRLTNTYRFKIMGRSALRDHYRASKIKIKTCYFASMFALLHASLLPVQKFYPNKINHILSKANDLFMSTQDKSIKSVRKLANIEVDGYLLDVTIKAEDPLNEDFINISMSINETIKNYRYFLLQIENCTYAIYFCQYFHLFDPYPTLEIIQKCGIMCYDTRVTKYNLRNTKVRDQNTAAWILFPNKVSLFSYIDERTKSTKWKTQFKIYIILINNIRHPEDILPYNKQCLCDENMESTI